LVISWTYLVISWTTLVISWTYLVISWTYFVISWTSIYILCLSASVCLYPINVRTAEQIGPKFCVGPHVTQGEDLWMIKIKKKLCLKVFYFCKILKMRENFLKFFMLYKEKMLTDKATIKSWKRRMGSKRPNSLVYLYTLLFFLGICLGVWPFVSDKRQNGCTGQDKIFCGTSQDPREGLWMIELFFASNKIQFFILSIPSL